MTTKWPLVLAGIGVRVWNRVGEVRGGRVVTRQRTKRWTETGHPEVSSCPTRERGYSDKRQSPGHPPGGDRTTEGPEDRERKTLVV